MFVSLLYYRARYFPRVRRAQSEDAAHTHALISCGHHLLSGIYSSAIVLYYRDHCYGHDARETDINHPSPEQQPVQVDDDW